MSQASDELEEIDSHSVKGTLNSKTILNILAMLGVFVIEKINENSLIIQDWIISLTPDLVDPFVPNILATAIAAAMATFGVKAVKGRIAVGDVKGIYKKPVIDISPKS